MDYILVELFGKPFQVDIGRIEIRCNFRQRFPGDVAIGDEDVFQCGFAGKLGRVISKFIEDSWFGIGVGNRSALGRRGFFYNFFWGARQSPDGGVRGDLRNSVVLAMTAVEIASGRGNGESCTARHDVIKRFFLDGIDMFGAHQAVDQAIKGPPAVFADSTDASCSILDQAVEPA